MRKIARAVAALTVCGVLAGCAARSPGSAGEGSSPGAAEGWREIAGAPLSPRELAMGLWTGHEALLLGGSDAGHCPPNADCPLDPTPLADGAAVDPATGRWRKIATAPAGFVHAGGAVAGRTAFVLPGGPEATGVLAYHLDEDRWERMTVPFRPALGYGLVAAGDRLVAWAGSDEAGAGRDYLFDPGTKRWSTLPDDPLGPAFDRSMAWTGAELVLFDHELVPNPNAEKPSVTRAAAFDPAAGSWRRLPDSEILSTSPWLAADGRLVNPTLGGSDGGEVGTWSREHPFGGILDPATGGWSPLPDPPGGEAAGARGRSSAVYLAARGSVLDTAGARWLRVPKVPDGDLANRLVLAAGTDMLIFGGAGKDGTLVNRTWIWSPPA
jgi:hypothetical protein